jgi:hypothetical protein
LAVRFGIVKSPVSGLAWLEGCTVLAGDDRQPERFEPLPGIFDLPGWLWRRMPPAARVASAVALIALIGVGIAIAPGIRESKEEREQAEREERLKMRAEREERIRRDQRPVFVDGAPATSGVPARRALVEAASASVLADARARVTDGRLEGPLRGVDCEPFPRSVSGVGAEDSTEERFGRYSCLAVTAEFARDEGTRGGSLGHPYRVRVDFDTGRYALCKVSGRPGEGLLRRRIGPTIPRACGGGP